MNPIIGRGDGEQDSDQAMLDQQSTSSLGKSDLISDYMNSDIFAKQQQSDICTS